MTKGTIHKVKEIMIQNNTLVRKPPMEAAFLRWLDKYAELSFRHRLPGNGRFRPAEHKTASDSRDLKKDPDGLPAKRHLTFPLSSPRIRDRGRHRR